MNREEKSQEISALKQEFSESPASILVSYKGLSVNQLQKLRRGVRQNGGNFKVAKTRLMRIAAEDIESAQPLLPYFKDQVGIVFCEEKAPVILKFLSAFSKENELFKLVVGSLDSKLVEAPVLVQLANLPSREVLLARLCGVLKAPISRLAFVLQQVSAKKQ